MSINLLCQLVYYVLMIKEFNHIYKILMELNLFLVCGFILYLELNLFLFNKWFVLDTINIRKDDLKIQKWCCWSLVVSIFKSTIVIIFSLLFSKILL